MRPGDGVPVDGEVLEGKSAVDESMVTGESMPATKQPGEKSLAARVNGTGSLVMRADKVGRGHPARADRADGGRGAALAGADPAAGGHVSWYFVPAVLGVAVIAFVAWAV